MVEKSNITVSAVTTDNVSNIKKATRQAKFVNIRCLAHSLNLAANRGLHVKQAENVVNYSSSIMCSVFYRSKLQGFWFIY